MGWLHQRNYWYSFQEVIIPEVIVQMCTRIHSVFLVFVLSISCVLSNLKFTTNCYSVVWHLVQRDCMSMEVLL